MAGTPDDEAMDLYVKGRDFLADGRPAEAIQCFTRSVELAPHFKALELLGEAFLDMGEPLRAIVPLAAATTLNRQVRAPALLAEALWRTGDGIHAHEMAQLALSRDPNNRRARAVQAATKAEHDAWTGTT